MKKAFALNWLITGLIIGLLAITIFASLLTQVFNEKTKQDANRAFTEIYSRAGIISDAHAGEEEFADITLPDIVTAIYVSDSTTIPEDIEEKIKNKEDSTGNYLIMKLENEKVITKKLKCKAKMTYIGNKETVTTLSDKIWRKRSHIEYPLTFTKIGPTNTITTETTTCCNETCTDAIRQFSDNSISKIIKLSPNTDAKITIPNNQEICTFCLDAENIESPYTNLGSVLPSGDGGRTVFDSGFFRFVYEACPFDYQDICDWYPQVYQDGIRTDRYNTTCPNGCSDPQYALNIANWLDDGSKTIFIYTLGGYHGERWIRPEEHLEELGIGHGTSECLIAILKDAGYTVTTIDRYHQKNGDSTYIDKFQPITDDLLSDYGQVWFLNTVSTLPNEIDKATLEASEIDAVIRYHNNKGNLMLSAHSGTYSTPINYISQKFEVDMSKSYSPPPHNLGPLTELLTVVDGIGWNCISPTFATHPVTNNLCKLKPGDTYMTTTNPDVGIVATALEKPYIMVLDPKGYKPNPPSSEPSCLNLQLDIGSNNIVEWSKATFSGKETIDDQNTDPKLKTELTSLLKDCNCPGCSLSPSGDECTIDLNFSSDTQCTLDLSDLCICTGPCSESEDETICVEIEYAG